MNCVLKLSHCKYHEFLKGKSQVKKKTQSLIMCANDELFVTYIVHVKLKGNDWQCDPG